MVRITMSHFQSTTFCFSFEQARRYLLFFSLGYLHIFYDYGEEINSNDRIGYETRQNAFYKLHNVSGGAEAGDSDDGNSDFMLVQFAFVSFAVLAAFVCDLLYNLSLYNVTCSNADPEAGQDDKFEYPKQYKCYKSINMVIFWICAIVVALAAYQYQVDYDKLAVQCDVCGTPAKLRFGTQENVDLHNCKASCHAEQNTMIKVDFYNPRQPHQPYCRDLGHDECCSHITNIFALTQHCATQDSVLDSILIATITQPLLFLIILFVLNWYSYYMGSQDGLNKSVANASKSILFDSSGTCMVPLTNEELY